MTSKSGDVKENFLINKYEDFGPTSPPLSPPFSKIALA